MNGEGFAGVILTLRHNAKVAREERDANRDHERKSLRVALIEELQINRRSLKDNSDKLKEDPPKTSGGAPFASAAWRRSR